MLLTFPQVFTAKNMRKNVQNEKDKEAQLRYKIYTAVTENTKHRETYIPLYHTYPPQLLATIKEELQERGFRVANYVDMSNPNYPHNLNKSNQISGLKISY